VEAADEVADYPGARRGLPESGPGSVATWGRRISALCIDWVLSLLAASALSGRPIWAGSGSWQWAPLAMFAIEVWVLTTLLAGSAGQLICRVTVRRTSGRPLDLLRALLRTLLICAVVPPIIYNRDRQGLHDMAVDSIALNR
jgi:RDD family